jgi:YidC/Oxa1 family membrane protein insertase
MDPSSVMDALSTFNLADAVVDAIGSDAVTAAADATSSAAAAATDAAANNPGWFGFLTGPIEGLLQIIHSALVAVGVSADAWGVSIIMMTVIIKVLTFPLTKTQLESTNKMQAIQPAVKELQAKYQSNPEVMNQKIAELYQQNELNPLAGCLPSFVQIPVFIGLYRAVLNLAKDNKLDEPFLWLPNLEGPTYGADPAHGSDWILKNWCVTNWECFILRSSTSERERPLSHFSPSPLLIMVGRTACRHWGGKTPLPSCRCRSSWSCRSSCRCSSCSPRPTTQPSSRAT